MLPMCKSLKGHRLAALDGEIGKVHDFYFDDQSWTVRYLVADTGYWLPGRLVLISPFALKGFDEREQRLNVTLTKQQIERCVGKKLWGQRQGPMGKAQAIENHSGHGFARRYHFLIIWHEMPVNHVHQP